MKTHYLIALSAAAGIAAGAAGVEVLQAQAKPHGYVIAEIDVSNVEGYSKEFLPVAGKALAAGGIKFLVRGGKTETIEGAPPTKRVVIGQFETIEKGIATYTSPAYLEVRKIGDKYAKFRIWAAEGVAE